MGKFNFDKVARNMMQLRKELPQELANDAQKFFNNAFRSQSWEGRTWQTPQRRIAGTSAYKYPKKKGLGRRTRATLVQSGRLRRTVATSLKSVRWESIKFVVNLPYADVHNEGSGKMPKRRFMGDSPSLRIIQKKKIKKMVNKIWQA